ncbi:hypothetical protein PPTG_05418 [Phytophthora nicotianae INRA-310]|uniref:HAT C-terminal dimerisation domain-containing protein n=1 Tax=Phytophthora nicotianae (strain INRA-310) TaxID=761204 RepID=W2QX09_PHYN3|nr:hypothetical protein PPTG_05418 [Phytophthora nicotianae INRA-310]ETN17673.1 hypothetical protein PPTG_05418 [Phytophthora nicotianae INRA-310]
MAAVVTNLSVPLIGCASNRCNLAVNSYLEEHKTTVEAVSALMAALRTVNNRAALREHTPLAPLMPHATRWSSTYDMVARYVRIRDEIKQVDAVFDLIPKAAMHRKIEALLGDLQVFHSVTIKLQSKDLSLADVRVLFDSILQRFPSLTSKLGVTASIVLSPVFEAATVINGETGRLTTSERKAVSDGRPRPHWKKAQEWRRQRGGEDRGRRRLCDDGVEGEACERCRQRPSQYCQLLVELPTTSNRCERLFSQAKLVLSSERASLLSVNFEMLMFLRANRSYWGVTTVQEVFQQM